MNGKTLMLLMMMFATALHAQQPATSTATATTTVAQTTSTMDAEELRNLFGNVVRRQPSDVATILALDPTLMSNETFLASYPDLAQFTAAHPEIRRNPRYYLSEFRVAREPRRQDESFEVIGVVCGFGIAMLTLTWLVRTFIEQSRWSRMSRTQSEVHNKILDRFGTGPELLEYVKSSAGTKFLESAPIPLYAAEKAPNAPMNRILWSIQIGIIVAAGAMGAILVSHRLDPEASRALFAMGAIALSVGIGFVASAAISVYVSRRLGIANEMDDPAGVR